MSIDGQEKDPLRKRSVRLNRRAATIAYYYERDRPDCNFSALVSLCLVKVIGPQYENKRGIPKRLLKQFNHKLAI